MQSLPFPTEFAEELKRIETLHDPERTAALERLNDMIFRSLTRHLFNRAQPNSPKAPLRSPSSPREELGNCSAILRRTTAISRSGPPTRKACPTTLLPRNGTIISVKN